jgi:hypothetical protein
MEGQTSRFYFICEQWQQQIGISLKMRCFLNVMKNSVPSDLKIQLATNVPNP